MCYFKLLYHFNKSSIWFLSLSLPCIIECTLREGSYIHKPPKNKAHFVEISKPFEDSYQWSNASHEKWSLTPVVGERNALRVGKECPYLNSGHMFAQFNEAGIYGPSNEFYAYQGTLIKPSLFYLINEILINLICF